MDASTLATARVEMPPRTEVEQARMRIASVLVIVATYGVAIVVFGNDRLVPAVQGLLPYAIFAVAWIGVVARGFGAAARRQHAAVVIDHAAFAWGLGWAGLAAAPLLWVPAFLSVGHGLRFGEQRARFSALVGSICTATAIYTSPEWRDQLLVSAGVLLSASLIPVYAVNLARKIEASRKESEEKAVQLEALVTRDTLTGLLNRRGFTRALQDISDDSGAAKEAVAVLYMDLDGFKGVNDTLGHAVGDDVLRRAALNLRGSVRSGDAVARIGGDEFAVILRNPGDRGALQRIGEKVLEALTSVQIDHHENVRVAASIGVCVAARGSSLANALVRADALMYRAKRAGRCQVIVEDL